MSFIKNEPHTLYGVWEEGDAINGAWIQRADEPWFTLDKRLAFAMRANVLVYNSQFITDSQVTVRQLGDDGRPVAGCDE